MEKLWIIRFVHLRWWFIYANQHIIRNSIDRKFISVWKIDEWNTFQSTDQSRISCSFFKRIDYYPNDFQINQNEDKLLFGFLYTIDFLLMKCLFTMTFFKRIISTKDFFYIVLSFIWNHKKEIFHNLMKFMIIFLCELTQENCHRKWNTFQPVHLRICSVLRNGSIAWVSA